MKKQKGWDEVICFESINIKIIIDQVEIKIDLEYILEYFSHLLY
jgi:hypothetical protein